MTHFIGAVLVPADIAVDVYAKPTAYPTLYGADGRDVAPGAELQQWLDTALARFDENLEVPQWISKEDSIADARVWIEHYATQGPYAEFLELGEEKYREKHPHAGEAHIVYLREDFPKKLNWTDEEVYRNEVLTAVDYDRVRESDGAILDTYNPDSKWDWWQIGGRWEAEYRDRQGETLAVFRQHLQEKLDALKSGQNLNPNYGTNAESGSSKLPWSFPYCIVLPVSSSDSDAPGFEWLEKGEMGWFALHDDKYSDIEWIQSLLDKTQSQALDSRLVYIDFHI